MDTVLYSFFFSFFTSPFIPEKTFVKKKKNHCFFWNKSLKSFLLKRIFCLYNTS